MVKTMRESPWRFGSGAFRESQRRVYRTTREGLGVSRMAAAQAAGIHEKRIDRWEHGVAELTPDEILKLYESLDPVFIEAVESNPKPTPEGERCRYFRALQEIGQAELARKLKWPQCTISLFESGYITLNEKKLKQLWKALESMRKYDEDVAEQFKLYRDIEASLRREVAELEKQVEQGRMGSLARLPGRKIIR
jgi:transcriptional regulator with XRE-family HTH domain